MALGPKTRFCVFAVIALCFAANLQALPSAGYPGSSVNQLSSEGGGGTNALPTELENVGIDENLGAQLPLDAEFRDENGRTVTLREYLQAGRPVLLNFAYFGCPMLCNLVLNGMIKGMKALPWIPGKEYEVLTISVDPREGPTEASAKKATHIAELDKAGAGEGWHFLTGTEKQIRSVADQVGFRYAYQAEKDEYAHAAGIFTISPQGKVMRYLYGIEYKPLDIRLALLDASKGRSMSLGDRFVTFCYRYDANTKGYVLFAKKFMKGGGFVVLLSLAALMGYFWRKELKRKAPVPQVTRNAAALPVQAP